MNVSTTVGQDYIVGSTTGLSSQSNSSFADYTNLTVTITTSGRPVKIMFIHDGNMGANQQAKIFIEGATSGTIKIGEVDFKYVRNGADIATVRQGSTAPTNTSVELSPATLNWIDFPPAGTHTYKIQTKMVIGTTYAINYTKMVAYEI